MVHACLVHPVRGAVSSTQQMGDSVAYHSFDLFEAAVTYARASTYPQNCAVNQKRVTDYGYRRYIIAAKLRVQYYNCEVFMIKKGENVSHIGSNSSIMHES